MKQRSICMYIYSISDFKIKQDIWKSSHISHWTGCFLFKKKKKEKSKEKTEEKKTLQSVWFCWPLWARRREGRGTRRRENRPEQGEKDSPLWVQPSRVWAQPQVVTSARSCAPTFAPLLAWGAVWTTAGPKSPLTQTALLGINWPGLLKQHLFGTKILEILFKDTRVTIASRVRSAPFHQHAPSGGRVGCHLDPFLVLMTGEESSLTPPVLAPPTCLSLVSSSLTLQNPTPFQTMSQAPSKARIKQRIFQNFQQVSNGFSVSGDTVFQKLSHKYKIQTVQGIFLS